MGSGVVEGVDGGVFRRALLVSPVFLEMCPMYSVTGIKLQNLKFMPGFSILLQMKSMTHWISIPFISVPSIFSASDKGINMQVYMLY